MPGRGDMPAVVRIMSKSNGKSKSHSRQAQRPARSSVDGADAVGCAESGVTAPRTPTPRIMSSREFAQRVVLTFPPDAFGKPRRW